MRGKRQGLWRPRQPGGHDDVLLERLGERAGKLHTGMAEDQGYRHDHNLGLATCD